MITRLDSRDGTECWTAACRGFGLFMHAELPHDVRLDLRAGLVIVWGRMPCGEYLESFDPSDGARIARWSARVGR